MNFEALNLSVKFSQNTCKTLFTSNPFLVLLVHSINYIVIWLFIERWCSCLLASYQVSCCSILCSILVILVHLIWDMAVWNSLKATIVFLWEPSRTMTLLTYEGVLKSDCHFYFKLYSIRCLKTRLRADYEFLMILMYASSFLRIGL